jgi:epoxyqueuosine reductase
MAWMTPRERSDLIKRLAADAGFECCGIAAAGPHPRGDFLRNWLSSGQAGTMGYLHRHVESRIDVRAWMPAARSVIVTALVYRQPDPEGQAHPPDSSGPVPPHAGRVAMYAWGEDYHTVIRDKLQWIVDRLNKNLGDATAFEARICVDTSAVTERELAAAAGIGWIGKNTLVLHHELGSYFFLGAIITDLELAADAPEADHCGTCTRCLEACPTQAFPQPYTMDARRCISYLTIEHRGEIEPDLAQKMGDWVFGCDICQEVCPFNQKSPFTREPRLSARPGAARMNLDEIEGWDEQALRDRTAGNAMDRARLHMWKRNARIVRENAK